MPILDLTVSYDGAPFFGYARQIAPDGTDRVRTVQGELEHALSLVFRREVATVCAGRTDAGVHAREQHASFAISPDELGERDMERLRYSLCGILPDEIAVTGVREASDGFSARFSAISREYRYLIVAGPVRPVRLRDISWWTRCGLDVDAMRDATRPLMGEHDFTSFCSAAASRERTCVRELSSIEIVPGSILGEECLSVRIIGNAFLHNMVRIIVGTLVDVGRGARRPDWVGQVLEARDRAVAGQTAPAKGLVFWHVEY